MNPLPDMGERHLLAVLVRSVAGIIALLIVSITSCSWHADYQAAQALAKGVDPVGVACALHGTGSGGLCALAAARGAK